MSAKKVLLFAVFANACPHPMMAMPKCSLFWSKRANFVAPCRASGIRFGVRFLAQYRWRTGVTTVVAACGLLLASCSSPRHTSSTTPAPPQPYTRVFRPDTNTVQLQIAVREFLPRRHRGPVVWLAGVSHVGDPEYYQALQRHLNAQTLVLYEGVNAERHKRRVREAAEPPAAPPSKSASPPASAADQPGLQSALAESLGLVFQLDAIDYDRTNFLNSDLSMQEIAQLMGGSAEPPPGKPMAESHASAPATANPSFNYLMQAMDGSSFLGQLMKIGVQFIGSSASLWAITRLTFIETIGQLKGDLAAVRGMPPDMQELMKVLIEARNRTVIEDLKKESRRVPRSGSIAIFYGTGHMDNMEKRLVQELNYRPAGEIWFTAFSADLRQTGLSPSQLQMVRNLIKWQLDQLQP